MPENYSTSSCIHSFSLNAVRALLHFYYRRWVALDVQHSHGEATSMNHCCEFGCLRATSTRLSVYMKNKTCAVVQNHRQLKYDVPRNACEVCDAVAKEAAS
eukprot:5950952-Pleurochrysis_carterae.AAC.1